MVLCQSDPARLAFRMQASARAWTSRQQRFITRNTLSLQEIPQPLAMTIHCHLISSTPLCARG
ncbi:mCG1034856, isoform CRA_a [Mus musculus]|nr:mCG1034856, isoform CRA_a [Mus musculus]